MITLRTVCLFLAMMIPPLAYADESADDAWLEDDWEARVARVNAGDLVFLTKPPLDPVHHHQSRITLDADSLDNGWVGMVQCHSHLDEVPRTQVTYHQTRTRNLSIVSSSNIGKAWVEGHTVQLAGVEANASVCIAVRTRALEFNEDGSFSLRNGPFMRRFLDGYYPMHVSMNIELPRGYLRFVETRPHPQDGFAVKATADSVSVETWFEGKLYTEIRFAADFCEPTANVSC